MNIPTKPPPGTGERNCELTTRLSPPPELANSTAPTEPGAPNRLTPMSSNALASRAASWNTRVAPLNRYTAVTVNTSVYDVLKTLTSDTNGTPPTPATDAATGSVTVSAESGRTEGDHKERAARRARRTCLDLTFVSFPQRRYAALRKKRLVLAAL